MKSRWQRAGERVASTRAGAWWFIHVASKVDPYLLKRSSGKWSLTPGQPICLLTHYGAKSGQRRESPLVYAKDGDNVILTASNGGSPKNPAWYHNLKAHPEVELITRDGPGEYVAREAEGAERERLWRVVSDVYSGYDTYQGRAPSRRIPLMVLEPRR